MGDVASALLAHDSLTWPDTVAALGMFVLLGFVAWVASR